MALSDAKTRNAKPKQKPYKLSDTDGRYLLVVPTGGKYWRFDYRYDGKRKTLALGTYPEVSLFQARVKTLEARQAMAQGIDPGQQKKAQRIAKASTENSFEVVAQEWYAKFLPTWTTGHSRTIISRLERDVFPLLGNRPIDEITAQEVLRILRLVENRGAIESAHRIKTICGQVFRYAIATGRADRDPTADLKGALSPVQTKHMAAITEPEQLRGLIKAIDVYQGSFVVKCALQLHALTFVRPGELRHAEWSEIDFETEQWNISAEKMKIKEPHIVPLSNQAVSILKELEPLTRHENGYFVFPNERTHTRPMSENAELAALASLGYKGLHTPHGFRATARTILDEVLQQRVDLIEHQLAHKVRDVNGRAYNRTAHLPARREMMQVWADYIDGLKVGSKILPLKKIQ